VWGGGCGRRASFACRPSASPGRSSTPPRPRHTRPVAGVRLRPAPVAPAAPRRPPPPCPPCGGRCGPRPVGCGDGPKRRPRCARIRPPVVVVGTAAAAAAAAAATVRPTRGGRPVAPARRVAPPPVRAGGGRRPRGNRRAACPPRACPSARRGVGADGRARRYRRRAAGGGRRWGRWRARTARRRCPTPRPSARLRGARRPHGESVAARPSPPPACPMGRQRRAQRRGSGGCIDKKKAAVAAASAGKKLPLGPARGAARGVPPHGRASTPPHTLARRTPPDAATPCHQSRARRGRRPKSGKRRISRSAHPVCTSYLECASLRERLQGYTLVAVRLFFGFAQSHTTQQRTQAAEQARPHNQESTIRCGVARGVPAGAPLMQNWHPHAGTVTTATPNGATGPIGCTGMHRTTVQLLGGRRQTRLAQVLFHQRQSEPAVFDFAGRGLVVAPSLCGTLA